MMHKRINDAAMNLAERVVKASLRTTEKDSRVARRRTRHANAPLFLDASQQDRGLMLFKIRRLALSPIGKASHNETINLKRQAA
jgi:hypothetical protein